MKFFNIFFFLFFLSITKISSISRALYLGKEKCFYDNYYNQMNILITYKIIDKDVTLPKTPRTLFKVDITSPDRADFFKVFYGSKLSGKFSYNVEESAKYKICIYSSDKDLFKKKKFLKVQFNIQSSDELFDANSAKLKDFQKVNDTMQKLNSKIDSIEEMQNYQIQVEDNFSKNQVLSSSRVALITIFQIFIIIIVGTYQVFSLRKVFKDKIWAPF